MAVPVELMVFRDARALAHYLAGAVQAVPALLSRKCLALVLEAPGEPGGPRIALQLGEDGQGPLPRPDERQERVRVVQAEVDLEAREVRVLSAGRGILRRPSVSETFAIRGAAARSNIVQAVPLEPWEREPEDPDVVFLSPPGEAFAALVTEHLELGRDALRYASTYDPDHGPRLLLEVGRPSWFLLSRWADGEKRNGTAAVSAFRRLPRRRVYVAWGKRHPLERFLPEPDPDSLLFADDEGRYFLLRASAWTDIGSALALDATRLDARTLDAAPDPGRIPVRLRLEGRPKPRDPELWILPEGERGRLERLLAQTPEEELKNLLVALVSRPDGSRSFVVREVLAGRAARLLPIGGAAYAALPGLSGLFLPCDRSLAPPLRNERYARAFAVKPGELVLLDDQGGGAPSVQRLKDAAFRPIDAVIDFVVDADAARLEEVALAAPFELGRFSEEDLVPPLAPPQKRRQGERRDESGREPGEEDERLRPKESSPSPARPAQPQKDPESGQRPRAASAQTDVARRAVIELERDLARDPSSGESWMALALSRLDEKDIEEAVRAAENAAWLLPAGSEEASVPLELLERVGARQEGEAAAPPKGEAIVAREGAPPSDAATVYRAVRAFARAAASAHDPEALRARVAQVHDQLRALEPRLRKKTRWLAWRQVLSVTGDRVEEERQREDVLAELVVRGVEDREVPPFVRHRLLERYSSGAAGAHGAGEALEFLKEAVEFAAATDKPAHRAAALAHVAWAYAELGQAESARHLARDAERFAQEAKGEGEQAQAYRARALARAAAVLERTDGPSAGRRLFQEALDTISRALDARPTRSAEERKAFAKWFVALADARAAQAVPDDPLVLAGLSRLEKIEPSKDRAGLLAPCADALARLGQAARGRQIARGLLSQPNLQLIYLEYAAQALEGFEEGKAIAPEDARLIIDAIRRLPGEVDEFTPDTLILALRADPRPPWDAAQEIASALAKDGHAYASLLVKLTGLRRLAELKDREAGPRLLARTFDEAWAHQGDAKGEQRMRILVRLARLVPAFGLRGQGLDLLQRMKDRARSEQLYNRNELLTESALSVAKLGETRDAIRLVEEVVQEVLGLIREPRREGTGGHNLVFESLEAAMQAAVELGESAWALPLVSRVAQAAREALAPSGERRGAPQSDAFFCYRALIRCGKAAVALGERDAAQAHLDDAFSRLPETLGMDRTDLLAEAAQTANELEGSARYELASRVLGLTRGALDPGEFSRQFAVDLAEKVAQDVVKGESAFAAALKRWKGDEERRIRDRVVSERFTSPS